MPTLTSLPFHIYVFAAILGVLLLLFVFFFFLPSILVSSRLSGAVRKLAALKGNHGENLDPIFRNTGVLEHLWQEYADTLHKQSDSDALTGEPVTRMRSTMPAGVIFRPEIIVDIPLRADFFKHLPGLFTGIGIIGTFYGLLIGLQAFEVSENAIVVRESLNRLLHGVWEAFLVSAVAITLAMIVTFIEKFITTRLSARVEKIVQLLDALFEGGASEEYLARLVKASESSSSQTNNLFRGEFRQMFAEFSEQQIAAANAASVRLGDRIVSSIETGLKEPLAEIAGSFREMRNDQATSVQTLLTNVLQAFGQQMEGLFGGQIAGINSLQRQTIQALQTAVVSLKQMASNMEEAGLRNAETMAEQLAEAMTAAESRQHHMHEQMSEFIDQLRLAVSASQGETQTKLQNTLSDLSDYMRILIDGLSDQVQQSAAASMKHQESLSTTSLATVGQFGEKVDVLVEGVNDVVAEMKSAVLAMRDSTGDAFSKMSISADTLSLAAKDFAAAGQGVTATLEKSSLVASQLTAASAVLSETLADHKLVRESMAGLVGSMQAIVEQARREAAISSDVITRIEEAAEKLVGAQKAADNYLARISDVLGEAYQSFSDGMSRAVGEANRDFHQVLSDSVKLLREGIQELEDTLGTVAGHA